MPENPGQSSSEWTRLERIQSDSVSSLYLAQQTELARLVWVKALNPGILPSSPLARSLFEEGRMLALLSHPNILQVFDCRVQEEGAYLLLEAVRGPSLRGLLERAGRLSPAAALAIGLQLARALGHCAEHDIVHGAICPEYVWLAEDGQLKLTHFSAARTALASTAESPELELSLTETTLGSPAYMSPERILGEPPQPASDIFSFGLVLYEMLAGEHPFARGKQRSVAQRLQREQPLALATRVPELRPETERIVQRCMEKFAADRFCHAHELASALAAELGTMQRSARELVRDELARFGFTAGDTKRNVSSEPSPTSRAAEPNEAGLGKTEPGPRASQARLGGGRRKLEVLGPAGTRVRVAGGSQRAVAFFALCFLVSSAGFATIELLSRERSNAFTASGPAVLELVPEGSGFLRVVALPWAEVVVDGVHVETTPFAAPIPLSPGPHQVTLRHPKGGEEHRNVRLRSGETLLLDVKFKLDPPTQNPAVAPADAGAPSP